MDNHRGYRAGRRLYAVRKSVQRRGSRGGDGAAAGDQLPCDPGDGNQLRAGQRTVPIPGRDAGLCPVCFESNGLEG
ncbi:hypothetical protein D3C73_1303570 [compost metagenome]